MALRSTDVWVRLDLMDETLIREQIAMRRNEVADLDEAIGKLSGLSDDKFEDRIVNLKTHRDHKPSVLVERFGKHRNRIQEEIDGLQGELDRRAAAPKSPVN